MDVALTFHTQSPRLLYFAGRLAARTGDTPDAVNHLETLNEVLAAARGSATKPYRDALEAEIALARGEPKKARELLDTVIESRTAFSDYFVYFSSGGAAFRDGLAQAYLADGDKEKAADAFEGLLQSGLERVSHPVLYFRALYQLGVLKSELGDERSSREYLEQFLEHWGEADWELPEVSDARHRLAS